MSSYLAALVVGNFEYVEGSADGIPIRVYSTPGKKDMGKFALDAAEYIVSYYDKYFGIKYPYGKLDLIGLPDFSAGAMENIGCITFREAYLLINEKQGSVDLKKTIASVTAHEIAHMWFGDLVTMKWWDDMWLNEGFATWMSSKPVQQWKPEWNFDLDDVSGSRRNPQRRFAGQHSSHSSGRRNSGRNSRIVRWNRLWQSSFGAAHAGSLSRRRNFPRRHKCVSEQHQYANATADDFWDAQAKTSKKPVDKIMPTWVKQAGVPIINVKAQCSGNSTSVTLAQQRYYFDRTKFEAANDQLWQIPLCLKGSASGNDCEVRTDDQERRDLHAAWLLNVGS